MTQETFTLAVLIYLVFRWVMWDLWLVYVARRGRDTAKQEPER